MKPMKKQTLTIILFFTTSILIYSQTTFYKNNLGIRPFIFNKNGAGIGVNYERYLDSTNNFSIYMPVDYILAVNNNNNNVGGAAVAVASSSSSNDNNNNNTSNLDFEKNAS
jgi:hypothetical protein